MLKIDNLTITTNTSRKLIDKFSFTLNDNDKIALIGEEGNGKSTLLKAIAGIDLSDYASIEGNVYTDSKIGYLPQAIDNKNLSLNTLDYISDDIDYGLLYEILDLVNIDYSIFDNRIIKTLSGGERVKLSLVKLLYSRPDILLLDEPTNDLDLKTLIWLEEFVNKIDLPLIFISHDETLLENCANGILHLEQLKRKTETKITFSRTTYKEYQNYRSHIIDRTNMIAAKEKKEFNKKLEQWHKIYQKVEHQQNTISRGDPHGGQVLKKKMHSVKAQERKLDIQKENLTHKYEPEEAINIFFEEININPNKVILDLKLAELKVEDKILARNIELYVEAKDKICIIGDNGSGKSTLIKIIKDELANRDDIKVGYIPQNYYEVMDYNLNPTQYLWDGKYKEELIKIQNYLGALKFTAEEMNHRINDLSEGQKCKILLLKMIINNYDVLLLDEPTRNLSPLSNPVLRNMLNKYGGCIISISHDRKYINEVSSVVYILENGSLNRLY